MSSKAALKAAKAALDAQKYEDAVSEASKVLDSDKDNYFANVFLGLALAKLDKLEESERAYNLAARNEKADALVWQGLVNLFESQNSKKVDEYARASVKLAEHFMKLDDKTRCQTVVDKYVGFAKLHGTRRQYKAALEVMLPESSLYDYLEGRIPSPAHTYTRIIEMTEAEETERINKEIGERRTRLGAKIGQVTSEVKREVLEASDLERLYGCIIDWTHDDDIRRLYEEKLLQRAYDTLAVLPMNKKSEKREQVVKLAEGLVILKHAFPLAWHIVLEWKDVESTENWDLLSLRTFVELFPEDGLSKVIKGYLRSDISPFPKVEEGAEVKKGDADAEVDADTAVLATEDALLLMTEGLEESSKSIMSQRITGEYFLSIEEYSSAVDCGRKAQTLIASEKSISGLEFRNNLDAVNLTLATALVQFQTPRHHPEARDMFDSILIRKPTNTSALIGVGLILEEEQDYGSAIDFLSRALERGPNTRIKAEASWCRAQNGDLSSGLNGLEEALAEIEEQSSPSRELKAEILYRIGWCMWNIDTSKAARKDRGGAYAKFLAALQANLNHASAYTSLGLYYADYARDKKRARKCFQKAFELSQNEVEAAERLARAFADQGEWDLVEVVAQRVVASGKVRPPPGSKRKGLSWPYAALGVCQLNNQEYPKSVASYQAALRISPNDYNCWVGLGESYHNSGRYIAATRVFEQALKVAAESQQDQAPDTWFCRYMLANVHRELGDFNDAVSGYEEVLSTRENEFGVSIALLQCHVENAWHSVALGLFGSAAKSAEKAILAAVELVKHKANAFNLWKAVGEACSIFSWIQGFIDLFPVSQAQHILLQEGDETMYSPLEDIDGSSFTFLQKIVSKDNNVRPLESSLHLAILSHKRAIHVSATDIHAQSVAWYNLGWTEWRAHLCLNTSDSQASKGTNKYVKAAVRCFKRAIELEAGNAEYWNSLGIVTSQLNPKVAQHSFVRSLHLNDKSARVWTNIGVLYLLQNDTQLANEAFTRGQSADPDYSQAWLGQGILALMLGETSEAQGLFMHAFEIADSSSVVVKQLYASTMFDYLLSSRTLSRDILDLIQPLFALHQLRSQDTADVAFHHLSALFAQRIGDHVESSTTLSSVCDAVEAEYEKTESPISLAHFAQAKADLARAQLAIKEFDSAAENAQLALDLSNEEESGKPDPNGRKKYRLSAHITAGLASYYKQDMQTALDMFRTALEETEGNPDTICILAQILWAKGGEEERGIARDQLFDCISTHPEHAQSTILLAVIAILDDDKETLEAVMEDLHSIRTRSDIDVKEQVRIGKLLESIALFTSGETSSTTGNKEGVLNGNALEMSEATSSIMLAPHRPQGWSQLANLSEDVFPADMALLTSQRAVPPRGPLEADDLAKAFAGTGRIGDAQRSVMVAPWIVAGWEGLVI